MDPSFAGSTVTPLTVSILWNAKRGDDWVIILRPLRAQADPTISHLQLCLCSTSHRSQVAIKMIENQLSPSRTPITAFSCIGTHLDM